MVSYSRFFCLALLCSVFTRSSAQNNPDYFKVFPVYDEAMPEWAQLMYSDDPDVEEVESAFAEYYKQNIFVKNVHTQNYKYWLRQVSSDLNQESKIRKVNKLIRNKSLNRNANNTWTPIGPFETVSKVANADVSSQANIYTIDQSPANPNKLISGVEGGGLYLSVDKAQNWTPLQITIDDGHRTITAAELDPIDENTFYYYAYGRKTLYKSSDFGASVWSVKNNLNEVYDIAIHPTNNQIVLFASKDGLFRSSNGGSTWSLVSAALYAYDVEFHPTNPSIVYALIGDGNKHALLYKSTDSGQSWTVKPNGYYNSTDPNRISHGGKIAVTPAAPDYVYVGLIGQSKAGDNGWIGVYRSTDAGENWTDMDGQDGGPYAGINSATDPWNIAALSNGYHQAFYNFDIAVSSTDPDLIWVGTVRLNESTDGGQTFKSIGAYNSTRLNVHPDIQDISILGSDIFVANDGGIEYSSDELQSSESRKDGINGSNYWGFGSGWNEDVLTGGRYHNGNSAYHENYPSGTHIFLGGGESPTGYVDPLENRVLRFHDLSDQIIPEQLSGSTIGVSQFSIMPNSSYSSNQSSGLYYDVVYRDWVYLGKEGILYKTEDNGKTFITLKNFGNAAVYDVEQSRANPDVLYVSLRNKSSSSSTRGEVWKSEDRGITWSKLDISDLTSSANLNISVAQDDESKLLVIGDKVSGTNAILTTDGGTSWTNVSDPNLATYRVTDLFSQPTIGGMVAYAAAESTVLKFEESTMSWSFFDDGLPGVYSVPLIRPFYTESKIRMSTRAYGIYEVDMPDQTKTIVQPYTAKPFLDCSSESVLFDSYSVADLQGTNLSWSFDPAPQYLSMVDNRGAMVTFGAPGDYDVTLTLSGPGGTYQKTEYDMITIGVGCDTDTDGDGIVDYEDDDIDGDGMPNEIEENIAEIMGGDVDLDGITDAYDIDSDGDGADDDYEEGNHCDNGGESVNTTTLQAPSQDIFLSDFDGQTSGVVLVRVESFVNCYSSYNEIYLLIDLDSEVMYNMGYNHFRGANYTSGINNDGTATLTSTSSSYGKTRYKLIDHKLYFSLVSNACGSWGKLVSFCRMRSDLNQNGTLDYKEAGITLDAELFSFTAKPKTNFNELLFTLDSSPNLVSLEIQKSVGRGLWSRLQWYESQELILNTEMTYADFGVFQNSASLYRLVFHYSDGSVKYSPIVTVLRPNEGKIRLVNNPVKSEINLDFGREAGEFSVSLISRDGKTIKQWNKTTGGGTETFNLDAIIAGIYFVRAEKVASKEQYLFRVVIN